MLVITLLSDMNFYDPIFTILHIPSIHKILPKGFIFMLDCHATVDGKRLLIVANLKDMVKKYKDDYSDLLHMYIHSYDESIQAEDRC